MTFPTRSAVKDRRSWTYGYPFSDRAARPTRLWYFTRGRPRAAARLPSFWGVFLCGDQEYFRHCIVFISVKHKSIGPPPPIFSMSYVPTTGQKHALAGQMHGLRPFNRTNERGVAGQKHADGRTKTRRCLWILSPDAACPRSTPRAPGQRLPKAAYGRTKTRLIRVPAPISPR